MEIGAIIAAAGSGTRLGLGSKALVVLNGRTAVARAVQLFLAVEEVSRIVVVAPSTGTEPVQHEVDLLGSPPSVVVCPGGASRQQSVRAGLAVLQDCEYVLVHDAARPMASPALVRRVLAAAVQTGAAIPGLPSHDAVKRVDGARVVESLDRSRLVLAQTPQAFRYQLLERAHFQAADAGLVGDDDAQLVAAAGYPVTMVPGEAANLKLTTPEDMALLAALLRERDAAEPRA